MRFFKERSETKDKPVFEGVVLGYPHDGNEYQKEHYLNSLKEHLEQTMKGECWAEKVTVGPQSTHPITECAFIFYPAEVTTPLTLTGEQSAIVLDPSSASQLWLDLAKAHFPDEYRSRVEAVYAGAI
jgi:hypothetical protein